MVTLGELACRFRKGKEFSSTEVLFSKLNCFDSAVQCLLQNPEQVTLLSQASVGDQIKIEVGRRHWRQLTQNPVYRARSGGVKLFDDTSGEKGLSPGINAKPHRLRHQERIPRAGDRRG